MEVWRAIPGYEGAYEASDLGRLRSLSRSVRCNAGHRLAEGQALNPSVRNPAKRYLSVNLHRKNRARPTYVHRAVTAAFLGPIPDGMQVDHIDGDRQNNTLTNLRYVTGSENIRAAHSAGRNKSGITDGDVRFIRDMLTRREMSQGQLASYFSVTPSFIYQFWTGRYRPGV